MRSGDHSHLYLAIGAGPRILDSRSPLWRPKRNCIANFSEKARWGEGPDQAQCMALRMHEGYLEEHSVEQKCRWLMAAMLANKDRCGVCIALFLAIALPGTNYVFQHSLGS